MPGLSKAVRASIKSALNEELAQWILCRNIDATDEFEVPVKDLRLHLLEHGVNPEWGSRPEFLLRYEYHLKRVQSKWYLGTHQPATRGIVLRFKIPVDGELSAAHVLRCLDIAGALAEDGSVDTHASQPPSLPHLVQASDHGGVAAPAPVHAGLERPALPAAVVQSHEQETDTQDHDLGSNTQVGSPSHP
jgi:hypothetical protein